MNKGSKEDTKKNIAKVDATTKQQNVQLPGDMLSDLQDAFNFYDKEGTGYVNKNHFNNILRNFGFHRLQKKETDDELKKSDSQIDKRTHMEFNFIKHVVTQRWIRGGRDDDAKECFQLFDRHNKGQINAGNIKEILQKHLEFPVYDTDVQEFMKECDPSELGYVSQKDFCKLYNS